MAVFQKIIDKITGKQKQADRRKQHLIQSVQDWGYFRGSIKSRADLWNGKLILDVGMGAGPHSVSFIERGCKNYIGVDPLIGSDHVRDFRNPADPSIAPYHKFPFSTDEIMEIYPNIHLYAGLLEDVASQLKSHPIDIAIMAAVTEHLQDLPAVFLSIWEILDDGGLLWFSHCNYYSWTGHHRYPRSVARWDRDDPKHAEVVNWVHLQTDHPCYINSNFNRVRLADLRALTEKYFEIIEWSVGIEAIEQLTPEIRAKYEKYTLEELLAQNIYVTGRRRDVPLDTDLSDRQFFHPDENYLANQKYLNEKIEPYQLMNFVYLSKGNQVNSHSTNNNAASRIFDTLAVGDQIRLSKFTKQLNLTVNEVIRPDTGALNRIKVVEDIPNQLIQNSRDQWSMQLVSKAK